MQVKSITENGDATGVVAAKELTRIAVEGDRILNVRGMEGAYDLKQDAVQGALFIRPKDNQAQSFSLFIATEQHHNYVLHLTPKEQPADTILLKPAGAVKFMQDSSPHPKVLAHFIKDMMRNPIALDDTFVKAKRQHSLVTMQLIGVYRGTPLQGYVYRLTNCSRGRLALHESRFYQRGDRAIMLSALMVEPGESVLVYKVRCHA